MNFVVEGVLFYYVDEVVGVLVDEIEVCDNIYSWVLDMVILKVDVVLEEVLIFENGELVL